MPKKGWKRGCTPGRGIRKVVCDNIVRLRGNYGMTQVEFGKKVNISANYVSYIETQKCSPSLEVVERVCTAFNLPYDYLFVEGRI